MDHKIRKNKKSYTFFDMYYTMPVNVPYQTYKLILDTMCEIILENILEGSDGFKMPYGLVLYKYVNIYQNTLIQNPCLLTSRLQDCYTRQYIIQTNIQTDINIDCSGLNYHTRSQTDTNTLCPSCEQIKEDLRS